MASERLDIVVSENGSRTVKRNIESIGDAALSTARGVRFLQNALFVLGGAGTLSYLQNMIDTVTNYRNRITLVTKSVQELNAVQRELFDIAIKTRSSYEGVADVYSRAALSLKTLGISQREVLTFTESLNKATILSGANQREANAALIQLGQALASNRLGGDELRSILEQLPYVADIIARSMGVTRGELRELGKEGKITGEVILKAFREARVEIDEKFAKTIPTIEQSFGVLNTTLMETVSNLDSTLGITKLVSGSIILLSQNLDSLLRIAVLVGVAFSTLKLSAPIIGAVKATEELNRAVALGNATLLTGEGIRRAKAASAALAVAGLTEEHKKLIVQSAILTGTTGRSSVAMGVFGGTIRSVTTAMRALWTWMLANPLTALVTLITTAIAALVVFSDKIILATYQFTELKNGIETTEQRTISLAETMDAAFTSSGEIFNKTSSDLKKQFPEAFNVIGVSLKFLGDFFKTVGGFILSIYKTVGNTMIGIFVFAFNQVQITFSKLPGAIADIGIQAMNRLISIVENGVNIITKSISSIPGISIDIPEVKLGRISNDFAGAASDLVSATKDNFSKTFGKDYLGTGFDSVMNNLFLQAMKKKNSASSVDLSETGEPASINSGSENGKKGRDETTFSDIVKRIEAENQALSLNYIEREKVNKVLAVEKELKRSLNPFELSLINNLLDENRLLEIRASLWDEIVRPEQEAIERQKELTNLYNQGSISLSQYTTKMRELKIAQLEAFNASNFSEEFIKRIKLMQLESERIFIDIAGQVAGVFGPGGSLSKGIGDSVADLIVNGKELRKQYEETFGRPVKDIEILGDMIKKLAKTILSQLVSSLVQVGVNMVINATLGKVLSKALLKTTTQAAAQAATVWAPAAALAATATLGGAGVAGAAGLALAQTAALSVAASSAASSSLGGYQSGGYTGDGQNNTIAGVVHKKEFVSTEKVTRKYRPELEAMENGSYSRKNIVQIKNNIYNNAPGVDVEVRQGVSADEVDILITRRMNKEVPDIVSSQLSKPNSRISKSIKTNTTSSFRNK